MMSLFSSFDSKLFNFWLIIFFSIFSILMSSLYKISLFNFYAYKSFSFLENFYQSTKSKSYTKGARSFLILIMLSFFLLNFCSLFPFSFTPTAQVSIVLFSSIMFWLSLFLFNITKNLFSFLSHCIPEGSPMGLIILLFLIELISSLIRPITLTVRLSANIIAGHVILLLLFKLSYIYPTVSLIYIFINLAEFFVCFIQAWIFSTLVALYYSEVN